MAIQVQELKIGNWIFDDNKTYSKVIGFSPFDHSARCDEPEGCDVLIDLYENDGNVRRGYICDSNKCISIPLSEDILVKAGFENTGNSFTKIFRRKDVLISQTLGIPKEFSFGYYREPGRMGTTAVVFHYLHQLQNLFYALTGTELNINLSTPSTEG